MLNRLFGTFTFRFMIFYVTCLSVAGFILLACSYAFYSYDFFNDINNALEHELDLMQAQYRSGGTPAVESLAEQRRDKNKLDLFSYIVVKPDSTSITGDITRLPHVKTWIDGWLSFETQAVNWGGNERQYNFMARSRELADGTELIVARLAEDVRQNSQLVAGTMFWSMMIMILLGVVGAAITSLASLQRVEIINKTISTIMSGDLTQRVPVADSQDDFVQLAKNLNAMLDTIESLMAGVRQVSDNIAHDLRTPLTRMSNNLTLLHSQVPVQQQALAVDLIGEAENLLATFNALLRISQVESGNRRSGFKPLDLSQIFTDASELYEPLAADKSIQLSLVKNDSIELRGDRNLLFQMLANLVDNAIKYTPDDGRVTLSLSLQNNEAVLLVSDSGEGVDDEAKEQVFQRFFRVEASRSRQPGNGLGLSLVAAVVKLHSGRIELHDANPGLTVLVRLPLS